MSGVRVPPPASQKACKCGCLESITGTADFLRDFPGGLSWGHRGRYAASGRRRGSGARHQKGCPKRSAASSGSSGSAGLSAVGVSSVMVVSPIVYRATATGVSKAAQSPLSHGLVASWAQHETDRCCVALLALKFVDGRSHAHVLLSPSTPDRGPSSPHWGLRINVDPDALLAHRLVGCVFPAA